VGWEVGELGSCGVGELGIWGVGELRKLGSWGVEEVEGVEVLEWPGML
jgi:hypothetical protein